MSLVKPRILIVEDEQAIIDTIQYALETEGCETRAVLSGNAARELFAAERFDLLLLDVGLPDINGLDLLKLIRQQSDVPVVFLTARSGDIDRVLGLELGGDDYVVKPFSPRELAARIKAVLRRSAGFRRNSPDAPSDQPAPGQDSSQASTDATVPAANRLGKAWSARSVWARDEKKRLIHYHGRALDLSRHEFDLLTVFLRRPGHVFTREQLMDLAWDEPESITDRTVDAHIKNLRAKLRAIRPDGDPIVTHRGIGYALREDA